MDEKWICLSINVQHVRKNSTSDSLRKELQSAFAGDMTDMVIVGNWFSDESSELSMDGYVFVKCRNYFSHVNSLKGSRAIHGVLESYDNPSFVDEAEVESFRKTLDEKNRWRIYRFGDVVKVKEGYLKDLHGIVVGTYMPNSYLVMFKFFTRSFVRVISGKNMTFDSSFFNNRKFPVTAKHNAKSGDKHPVPSMSVVALPTYIANLRASIRCASEE